MTPNTSPPVGKASISQAGASKINGLATSVVTDQYTVKIASRGAPHAYANPTGNVNKQTNTAGVNGAMLGNQARMAKISAVQHTALDRSCSMSLPTSFIES